MTKTKEQLEEEKKISLSIRIKPLELDGNYRDNTPASKLHQIILDMDLDSLKTKARDLWDLIVKLETERYDLEEKVKRQDYDVKIHSFLIKYNLNFAAQRAQGETETAEQTEGYQARTGS